MSDKPKFAILLLGARKYSNPAPKGEFRPLNGFQDLVYQGRLLEQDELNAAAERVFDKQTTPAGHIATIRVVRDPEEYNAKEVFTCATLPETIETQGGNHVCTEALAKATKEHFGYSTKDWNNGLSDKDRENFILRGLKLFHDGDLFVEGFDPSPQEGEPSDPPAPDTPPAGEPDGNEPEPASEETDGETSKEEGIVEKDPRVVKCEHRGFGKYDCYDADGNIVYDNITKAEKQKILGE